MAIAKIGAPILCGALVIGVIVSMIQAITQINEATLGFLPKVAYIMLAFTIFGPYFLRVMTGLSQGIFDHIVIIGGS